MDGRLTFGALTLPHWSHSHASPQIALASAASVFPRFTYGLTEEGGMIRTACPRADHDAVAASGETLNIADL